MVLFNFPDAELAHIPDGFDLVDLAVDHFKTRTENDRLIIFLYDSYKPNLTGNRVCGIDLKIRWAFGCRFPEPSTNRNFFSLFYYFHITGDRQAIRIVLWQGCQILIHHG